LTIRWVCKSISESEEMPSGFYLPVLVASPLKRPCIDLELDLLINSAIFVTSGNAVKSLQKIVHSPSIFAGWHPWIVQALQTSFFFGAVGKQTAFEMEQFFKKYWF
jgi:uroporphyrinogen-III synthase